MLEQMGKAAKLAYWQLAVLSTAKKNQVLVGNGRCAGSQQRSDFAR